MSLFRLARPAPLAGRAYSSFFSSKPGGGRHFVSAKPPKPPKPVLQHGRAKVDNTTEVTHASSDEKPSSKPAESHPESVSAIPVPSSAPPFSSHCPPVHPALSPGQYKLHQFFSLHRPMLLLNQPTSAIFDAVDSSTPLFTSSDNQATSPTHLPFTTIDSPSESSPDADADAARQLAHTLVMNRVASTIAWEQVLSRLGLDAGCSGNDMASAKEAAQEWVTIHADSTRRKKRKKMKKHKLKKRRRLTRRQNK